MTETPRIIPGFPEMWRPVYEKYQPFFLCAHKLMPIVNEVIRAPIEGPLLNTVCRMLVAASNSYGALIVLALNGYGHDAMKIARSIFETELNIIRLKTHPEELNDFLDYIFIIQKKQFDMLDDGQKKGVAKGHYEEMMAKYNDVLPRFASKQDRTRPRNEWCRESIYARAKEAGIDYLDLYQTFYREASSLHHLDIGGLVSQADKELYADIAPSWACIEDALVATGSFVRSVGDYDEMGNLGFKDRLQTEVNEAYAAAVKSLA
jgi:hypothetical protein